jgi:ADP-L-glycero-D-manno-heptose 6-epimerase
MIVITGALGFIGSCLVSKLNSLGEKDLVLVDDFSNIKKSNNLLNKKYKVQINRDEFFKWFKKNFLDVKEVYHIGARTDTAEVNENIFNELNLNYSKKLWIICSENSIPFIYASSAATYGLGEFGFDDQHSKIKNLVPLNAYGRSKNEFDKWVLTQNIQPPFWAGFKFFNVYGPNEFHKGRMASVVFHAVAQIKKTGSIKLFKSHNSRFKNGEQLRDFIYVKDLIDVLVLVMSNRPSNGIYNLGTGEARTFIDLAEATFKAMNYASNISFINIPSDIRHTYQYYTQADMKKINDFEFIKNFRSLEDGVSDYVKNHLLTEQYF